MPPSVVALPPIPIIKQAERFGARSEYAEVLRMDLTAVPKLVETSEIRLPKRESAESPSTPLTLSIRPLTVTMLTLTAPATPTTLRT